jgi:serine phosphatase RsbU (regulator of sigma subunit)/tetratricopeptide (TPR) repeat protein
MHKLQLLLLLIFPTLVFGQNFTPEEQFEIDSLQALTSSPTSHDTSVASAYLKLSGILYVSNLDTMIPLCNKAIAACERGLAADSTKRVKDKLLNVQSGAYNNIAFVYMSTGKIDEALEYLIKSLDMVKKLGNKKDIATGINNLGYIYNNQGHVNKALKYYHQSLAIEEELNNTTGIATSLNNIGSLYKDQDDNERALEYYQRSLVLLMELKDKKGIASSYNNLGAIYAEQGDEAKALSHYFKSLSIQREIGNKEGESNCLNSIGYAYSERESVDSALHYYYQSLSLRRSIDDVDGVISSSLRIAKVMLLKGRVDSAKIYAASGLELSYELGYPKRIMYAAELLSEVYELDGNSDKALEMLRLHMTMKDSTSNEDTKAESARQQAKYKYHKRKLMDDAIHDQLMADGQDEKKKQRLALYAGGISLVVVVLFLIFVFSRLKITRRQKNVIELQKEVVETAHLDLRHKNKEILASISYAKRIQTAILPTDEAVQSTLPQSFILFQPKDIVAGDFYWLLQQEKTVLFAAADCTGHGVPGAMVSVVCNNALNRAVREQGHSDPGRILDETRAVIIEEFAKSHEDVRDGMDIALCSLEGTTLKYAGANNPLWIMRKGEVSESDPNFSTATTVKYNEASNCSLIQYKADKQPIGKYYRDNPYTTHTINLNTGDTIYIFSDGYIDQFGGTAGKKLKGTAFAQLLFSVQSKPIEVQKGVLEDAFVKWKGHLDQVDDVCVIGVKV